MKNIIFLQILMALISFALLSGCAVTNKFGPYMGKVIDAETKRPIEGAVVFMECFTQTGNPGGITSHYADATEVLTNQQGEFSIELRATTLRPGHLWQPPSLIIFKPGYGVFPDHQSSHVDITTRDSSYMFPESTYVTISLPRLQTTEERKANLRQIYLPFQSEIPFEKWQNLFRLRNIENIQLGFTPYNTPN